MSKEIMLHDKYICLVDDCDYMKIFEHPYSWYVSFEGRKKQFKYVSSHIYENGIRKTIRLHRFILDPPKGMIVDHINGNPLDNRRCNLRICTNSDNQKNRHVILSKCGFKGVVVDPRNGFFRAMIRINGKKVHIGNFNKKEDAAKAYDLYAKKYHGDFARTNFEHIDNDIMNIKR